MFLKQGGGRKEVCFIVSGQDSEEMGLKYIEGKEEEVGSHEQRQALEQMLMRISRVCPMDYLMFLFVIKYA